MTAKPDGEVVIKAGGKAMAGWTEVSISGGLDMMPAAFDIALTERYPGIPGARVLNKGDPCTIEIGGDLVLTGWINRYSSRVDAKGHHVRVIGRSRCQDLVDCAALPKSLQVVGCSIGSLAKELVAPFAGPITVQLPDGDGDGKAYTIGVSYGETPFEIISAVASYEGMLVHDDARGDLVICRVGTKQTASGFREGVNVETFDVTDADDQIYSLYIPVLMSSASLGDLGNGEGNNAGKVVADPLTKRYRPLIIVSPQTEVGGTGDFIAHKLAVWEATRRRGRGKQVSLTTDSWRDSAGKLWTHNVLAALDLPTIHVAGVKWIIASWNMLRDGKRGSTCRLTLMSADAFAVQPSALNAVDFQHGGIAPATGSGQPAPHPALGPADAPSTGKNITAPNATAPPATPQSSTPLGAFDRPVPASTAPSAGTPATDENGNPIRTVKGGDGRPMQVIVDKDGRPIGPYDPL